MLRIAATFNSCFQGEIRHRQTDDLYVRISHPNHGPKGAAHPTRLPGDMPDPTVESFRSALSGTFHDTASFNIFFNALRSQSHA
jgi:hypothetical protein